MLLPRTSLAARDASGLVVHPLLLRLQGFRASVAGGSGEFGLREKEWLLMGWDFPQALKAEDPC